MFESCQNTKKQGDVGLGAAIAWFCRNGYTVSLPLTDSQDYDLIVDSNGELFRVQVKTTSFKENNNFYTSLTVKGGNRSSSGRIKKFSGQLVDLLFILTSENDQYLIPVGEDWTNQSLTLGEKYNRFRI